MAVRGLAAALGLTVVLAGSAFAQSEGLFSEGLLRGFAAQIRNAAAALGRFEAPFSAVSPAPSPEQFPVRGIDVSHYQDAIRWDEVRTAGYSFAYIKASEGEDYADDRFEENWKGARRAGLRRGAYHFYNFCKPAQSQAALFIQTVPCDPDSLPPTIDIERSSSCRLPGREAFRKQLAVMMEKLEAAYGQQPVLYVNDDTYDLYLKGDSADLKIWFSDFLDMPSLPDGRAWTFWQYSERGRVSGVDGPVDLNVYRGDPEQFASAFPPKDAGFAFASLRVH